MGSRLEKNSESVRKRIESHTFEDEEGEEYESSKFGSFSDYFRRKKLKLQNLDSQIRAKSDKPQIFRGIVAQVNGYTQPSLNDLHHMIVSHGGGFMQYLDGKTSVTHIIAASLTPKKAIEFKRYRIVKPAWVVDSVNAGRLLPWESYRVVDEGVGQRLLTFDEGRFVSQANTPKSGYRDQTNASWYTSQVKNVADDIDDAEGAVFPSTQQQVYNGLGTHTPGSALPKQSDLWERDREKQSQPAEKKILSQDYEVTSSLEDALAAASHVKLPEENPQTEVEKPELQISNTPPSGQGIQNFTETANTTIRTPVKPLQSLNAQVESSPINPGKHSLGISSPSPSKRPKTMTAEEHNALLLADPHMRKSSTANPEFLKQYYSESRLHHLSTWKAELKAKFQQMAAEKSASQRQPPKRKPGSRRYVLHVDFDSFFCAVSLKKAPEYVDKPAAVAHGSGSGSEIASCNYPARAFGIKNGMWMKKALELYSGLKVLPYDFPAYEEASAKFYEAIIDVGGIVQSVSIDEALLDVTALCLPAGGSDGHGVREGSIWREQEKAEEIATNLRTRIKEMTGCAVSVGIGGNILLAKVALRRAKPAGQYQIKPEEALDFLGELTVQDLPGVAYSIGGKLEELGIKFVKDIRSQSKERLMTILGPKTGEKLWDYSRGIDRAEVGEQVVRKSVSADVNWGIRFISQEEAEEFVQNLCGELQCRLTEQKVRGKHFTMKIMHRSPDAPLDPPKHLGHGKCDTYNKSIILGVATNSAEIMGKEAVSILRSYNFSPGELRGLGVQMTKLEPVKNATGNLVDGSQKRISFANPGVPKFSKKAEVDPIIDDIESPEKNKGTPVHPARFVTKANEADESAKKKLNMTGTQFILPTQVDPEVLKELPQDIRSRLMAQGKNKPPSNPFEKSASRAQSPALLASSRSTTPDFRPKEDLADLALPSQLDPEVFSALPDDMKAEVLAEYRSNNASQPRNPSPAPALLPQSPRKPKLLKPRTPTKPRGRGRPPKVLRDTMSHTLTQSNFISFKSGPNAPGGDNALDPDFLAALPEDMRAGVIADHNRRLTRLGLLRPRPKKKISGPPVPAQFEKRVIRLPPRPPKPSFTTAKLQKMEDLRESVREWCKEFEEDGPIKDDVAAFGRFLGRVVIEEGDVGKVVGVLRWWEWCLEDMDKLPENEEGRRVWNEALERVKETFQAAVKERGLGKVDI